jgi:hypothetical protein
VRLPAPRCFAIPGSALAAIETSLATIIQANAALEQFHQARAGAPGG